MRPPLRQVFVHDGYEAIVVTAFDQMREFVDNDVFEALDRFLGQFSVEADTPCAGVAASPFGFHLLHEKATRISVASLTALGNRSG